MYPYSHDHQEYQRCRRRVRTPESLQPQCTTRTLLLPVVITKDTCYRSQNALHPVHKSQSLKDCIHVAFVPVVQAMAQDQFLPPRNVQCPHSLMDMRWTG